MNCLFLDIASHNGALACVQDDVVLSFKEVSTRIRDHELVPLVEELLKEAKWNYEDLTNIACVVGPGGFTSLRVAVSYANTLIDQLGIEGAGVHLSELYRAGAGARARDCFWLHATKRDALFVRGFGEYEKMWPEPALLSIDEVKGKIPQDAFWMGELLDEQKEALAALELQEAQLESLEAILPNFVKGLTYAKKPLVPWYGRGA